MSHSSQLILFPLEPTPKEKAKAKRLAIKDMNLATRRVLLVFPGSFINE